MFKLAVVGTVLASVSAKHPVSNEIVAEIKAKTTAW